MAPVSLGPHRGRPSHLELADRAPYSRAECPAGRLEPPYFRRHSLDDGRPIMLIWKKIHSLRDRASGPRRRGLEPLLPAAVSVPRFSYGAQRPAASRSLNLVAEVPVSGLPEGGRSNG